MTKSKKNPAPANAADSPQADPESIAATSPKDESAEALGMVAEAMQRRAEHHRKTMGPAFDPNRPSNPAAPKNKK